MSTLFGDTRSHSVGLPTIMSIRSFSYFFKAIRAPPVKILALFYLFYLQEGLCHEQS